MALCENPRVLKNPTKDFRVNDSLFLTVACGQCWSCRTNKKTDMYVRIYKQMEWNTKHGYKNYFVTFTYNEQHLPYLRIPILGSYDSYGSVMYKTIRCFDFEDWRLFIQNLKKTLKRKYKIEDLSNFFVACEYGGKFGRPHLHIHLGVSDKITPEDLHALVKKLWCGKVLKFDYPTDFSFNGIVKHFEANQEITDLNGYPLYDGLGYIFPQKPTDNFSNGKPQKDFEVDSNGSAAYYCSKYVGKDLYFYKDEDLRNYIDYLRDSIKNDPADLAETSKAEYDIVKRYLPFCRSSKLYGSCVIDELIGSDDDETAKNIERGVALPHPKGGVYYARTPFYIQRKMLYNITYLPNDRDGKPLEKPLVRYDLNSVGVSYKTLFYDAKVMECETKLREAYNQAISSRNPYVLAYRKQFDKVDWRLLSEYRLVYQHRIVPSLCANKLKLSYPETFDIDVFNAQSFFEKSTMMICNSVKRYGLEITSKMLDDVKGCTYNDMPIFLHFDEMLGVLDNFQKIRTKGNNSKKIIKFATEQELKHKQYVQNETKVRVV